MDHFRPRNEPARSIYDALMTEASKRKGRSADEWMIAERAEVFREATGQAQKLSLRSPSIEEVERQEQLAMGHSDYAAKWAIGVADLMTH